MMTAANPTTRELVNNFIHNRLRAQNLSGVDEVDGAWSNFDQVDGTSSNGVALAVRSRHGDQGPADTIGAAIEYLTHEFERRYEEVFHQTCNQLHVTPSTARQTFHLVVNDIFQDGINWGRIVALFAFGGTLATQCVEKEMPLLVDQLIEWMTVYTDTHLMSWILQNGGWVGCLLLASIIYVIDGQVAGKVHSLSCANWHSVARFIDIT